ncbi:MAG: hypothetical protein GF383_12445 [Candidatus Lokiarchaeota archaeon]|nr:hypothetical protein [Candidatus Lokiarchaeota archaeon]MBD3341811.1 hypothetical protein [Candidatus Lokiarchaeota archaeon]
MLFLIVFIKKYLITYFNFQSMRKINDLWILTENGESVFYSNKKEPMESHFLAMLMSAVNSIANKLSKTDLTSIEFDDNKYNLLKRNGLLFVGRAEINTRKKSISKELQFISDCFFEKYGEDFINKWNSNAEYCVDFEKHLENVLPGEIERLSKGFGWDI